MYQTGQPLIIETDIEVPQLNPGQVLVKVFYSGVCHSQLMEARGKRGEDRFLPHLLGHEGSGVVVDTGSQVRKVQKGDSVILTWIKGKGVDCPSAKYRKGNLTIHSGAVTTFSDYSIVSENRCVKFPNDIPMDIASLFGCAVLTGAGIVLNTIKPVPEHTIAVWGVGGIGLSALMAAKLCECACIIAVDVESSKLELAKEFGATHLINATVENPLDGIYHIMGGRGVDFAVEAAGRAATIEQAFQSVRKEGGLCVFASHPPMGDTIQLDPFDLICGKQIRGSWGGESRPDEDVPRFVELYRKGLLPVDKLITHRYSLEQINQALSDLEQKIVGRALIEICKE